MQGVEATVVDDKKELEQNVWLVWQGCSSDGVGSDKGIVFVVAEDGRTFETGQEVETPGGGELPLRPTVEGSGMTEERVEGEITLAANIFKLRHMGVGGDKKSSGNIGGLGDRADLGGTRKLYVTETENVSAISSADVAAL